MPSGNDTASFTDVASIFTAVHKTWWKAPFITLWHLWNDVTSQAKGSAPSHELSVDQKFRASSNFDGKLPTSESSRRTPVMFLVTSYHDFLPWKQIDNLFRTTTLMQEIQKTVLRIHVRNLDLETRKKSVNEATKTIHRWLWRDGGVCQVAYSRPVFIKLM